MRPDHWIAISSLLSTAVVFSVAVMFISRAMRRLVEVFDSSLRRANQLASESMDTRTAQLNAQEARWSASSVGQQANAATRTKSTSEILDLRRAARAADAGSRGFRQTLSPADQAPTAGGEERSGE